MSKVELKRTIKIQLSVVSRMGNQEQKLYLIFTFTFWGCSAILVALVVLVSLSLWSRKEGRESGAMMDGVEM